MKVGIYFPFAITLALHVLPSLAALEFPRNSLGFNSGALLLRLQSDETVASNSPKVYADYKAEFDAAKQLNTSFEFNSVRLFTMIKPGTQGAANEPSEAIKAAIDTNTTMLLGLWCPPTGGVTDELQALHNAIKLHGNNFTDRVLGISVGSEDVYRYWNSAPQAGHSTEKIISFVDEVRKSLEGSSLANKPIGHVDTWNAWTNSSTKALINSVDFLGASIYPYYQILQNETYREGGYDKAVELFDAAFQKLLKSASGKPVWIAETGWTRAVAPAGENTLANVKNAARYWREIGCRKLFGKVNVWWYNLRDSNNDISERFSIVDGLDKSVGRFDLTCEGVSSPQKPGTTTGTATTKKESVVASVPYPLPGKGGGSSTSTVTHQVTATVVTTKTMNRSSGMVTPDSTTRAIHTGVVQPTRISSCQGMVSIEAVMRLLKLVEDEESTWTVSSTTTTSGPRRTSTSRNTPTTTTAPATTLTTKTSSS